MDLTPREFIAHVTLQHEASNRNRSERLAQQYDKAFDETPDSLWLAMYEAGMFTPATAYSEWVCTHHALMRMYVPTRAEVKRSVRKERHRLLARIRPNEPANPKPEAVRPEPSPYDKFGGTR